MRGICSQIEVPCYSSMQAKFSRSWGKREASEGIDQYSCIVKAEVIYGMMSVATEEALSC